MKQGDSMFKVGNIVKHKLTGVTGEVTRINIGMWCNLVEVLFRATNGRSKHEIHGKNTLELISKEDNVTAKIKIEENKRYVNGKGNVVKVLCLGKTKVFSVTEEGKETDCTLEFAESNWKVAPKMVVKMYLHALLSKDKQHSGSKWMTKSEEVISRGKLQPARKEKGYTLVITNTFYEVEIE